LTFFCESFLPRVLALAGTCFGFVEHAHLAFLTKIFSPGSPQSSRFFLAVLRGIWGHDFSQSAYSPTAVNRRGWGFCSWPAAEGLEQIGAPWPPLFPIHLVQTGPWPKRVLMKRGGTALFNRIMQDSSDSRNKAQTRESVLEPVAEKRKKKWCGGRGRFPVSSGFSCVFSAGVPAPPLSAFSGWGGFRVPG